MKQLILKLLGLGYTNTNNPVATTNNRLKIYSVAVSYLGKDASPNDIAPDEVGCAETVCSILQMALGKDMGIGYTVSTNLLYNELEKSPFYTRIDQPLEGDIWISPSGYGNGGLSNGHVGIIGNVDNKNIGKTIIMSNNSSNGIFTENYTIDSWKKRYVKIGGYPCLIYRKI